MGGLAGSLVGPLEMGHHAFQVRHVKGVVFFSSHIQLLGCRHGWRDRRDRETEPASNFARRVQWWRGGEGRCLAVCEQSD